MKKYTKPSYKVVKIGNEELICGSLIVDETGLGTGYGPAPRNVKGSAAWDDEEEEEW